MTIYRKREIAPLLSKVLKEMPVVVLTGMRQSGKSTLLRREPFLHGRHYLSLDDFAVLTAAEKDPETLLSDDRPVIVDEAQKAPQILSVIKRIVDERRKPGQFILSGSANPTLLKNVSESLAGRAVYLNLLPMSRREILRKTREEPFLSRLIETGKAVDGASGTPIRPAEVFRGGMPSVCLREVKDPRVWFQGYEQTYLERDVRAISPIEDLISFRNLLQLAAFRTSQVLNQSELGRDAKLNASTAGRYLSLFETSFLISRLPPYFRNRAVRLVKSPKLYFSDSGLAAYLVQMGESAKAGNTPLFGMLFETYVHQNLMGLLSSKWPQARMSFWNIQGRQAVDFIIEAAGQTIAIEVKAAARWQDKDLSGLRVFLEKTPHCQAGILAYNGDRLVSLGSRLWAVPVSRLIS